MLLALNPNFEYRNSKQYRSLNFSNNDVNFRMFMKFVFLSFRFVSIFGFWVSTFVCSWRPLRLAPWNILSTEALSFHSRHYFTGRAPWNTDSTKTELFARSAIPWGKSPFIRFPKPKFICNPEGDVPALFRTGPSVAWWGLTKELLSKCRPMEAEYEYSLDGL